MNRYVVIAIIVFFSLSACQKKNNMSKIPQITFVNMLPDSTQVGSSVDTIYITFNFADGDADIGNTPNTSNSNYDIFVKDSRYDSVGFLGYFFPAVDQSIEDPTKGLTGTITFKQPVGLLKFRTDSIHFYFGDTLHYQLYIVDRAGHMSDTITTPNLYIRP